MPSAVLPSETTSSWLTTGHPIGRFIDAVMREHVGLAFRGGGSVAAHGRKDERLRSLALPVIDNRLHDGCAMLWIPRLPTPMATRAPGFRFCPKRAASNCVTNLAGNIL